ncbi:MAG TPA: DUF1161 domain-containing protein [Candidatus Solibacter sp.]|nr:DUF1161 domain-containing protein [Candidatus Solibacter sp.]
MKTQTLAAMLLLACSCAFAQTEQAASTTQTARKSCEDLKSEIAKKLDAKNVTGYTLDIVDKGKEGDGKVVGGCDGGTKSILYVRGGAAKSEPQETKKSQ